MSEPESTSWYSKSPKVGDTIMFTTCDSNTLGYIVTLDEFSDHEAFLPFSELSARNIRKNPSSFLKQYSKHCGNITDIGEDMIYLSLKDVSDEQKKQHSELFSLNNKLFGLCRRLSHFDFGHQEWHNIFRTAMEQSLINKIPHPYNVISDRTILSDSKDLMPPQYINSILHNHVTLFGMKPTIIVKKFMLITFDHEGNQLCKDEINRIFHELKPIQENYDDETLYNDQDKFNITVSPIALPIFSFSVTAFHKKLVDDIVKQLEIKLKNSKFNIIHSVE